METIELSSIIRQYKGCGACLLVTNNENQPLELLYVDRNDGFELIDRLTEKAHIQGAITNRIYYGQASGVAFHVSHEIVQLFKV